MTDPVFICDAVRTPFGKYGGALSSLRPDDLGALVLKALIERNTGVNWTDVDDVIFFAALEPIGTNGQRLGFGANRIIGADAFDHHGVIIFGVRVDGAHKPMRHADECAVTPCLQIAISRPSF